MERKQEEQARQMKELQGQVERLQCKNYQLQAQIEKSRDLGKDVRDSGRDAQLITRNKGTGPVVPGDIDTLVDDELSSGSSPSLNLSLAKNTQESTRTRSRNRLSSHPASVTLLAVHLAGQAPGNPVGVALKHVSTSAARASCHYLDRLISGASAAQCQPVKREIR